VREFLEAEVVAGTQGRLRYQARVAANALAMVERELERGPDQQLDHDRELARLGFADDAELAAAIRRGELDDRLDEVAQVVRRAVRARLEVAHPGYR
jgi:hypothetical protein